MKTSCQDFSFSSFKKIFLSFLLLLVGYLGYSQVSFGIKSGINIATTKDLIAYPKNRIGWYAGGVVKIQLYKKFFLQPELLYSSKGNGVNQINNSKAVFRFNYVNIPILLGYKIDHKTFLTIGPEFGYLTSVHLVHLGNENLDVSSDYPPKFDFSLDIGLNYKLIKDLDIEARYNYGFKTIYATDAIGNRYSDTKGGNRVFQVGLNYIF